MAFENIPREMRQFKSWCMWRHEMNADGKFTKRPYSCVTGYPIPPNDLSKATTYENVIAAMQSRPDFWAGIGFMVSENDPYVFIDLDEPKNPDGSPVSPEVYAARFANQKAIYEAFPTYTEFSPSGKGLHIIMRGEVPAGRKRDNVEIYPNDRFMTMTGNVYRDAPIQYFNGELRELWEEMGKGRVNVDTYYAGLDKETLTDQQIIDMAAGASNGELFRDLFFDGNWQKWNYQSNNPGDASSEADFALVDIIGFYSRNRAQTARIFLSSKLGKRAKYKTHKYVLGYMLNRCFDNLPPPLDIQTIANNILESQAAKKTIEVRTAIQIDPEKDYLNLPEPQFIDESRDSVFNPPPGMVGDIARFIYSQSYMPVPEIALCAAIGLMAGICGKAYNTPTGTGLNHYMLILAATGTGKEEGAKGIWKLVNAAAKLSPAIKDFMGPSEIASTPALLRHMAEKSSSIVSILGEFGMYFKNLTAANTTAHMSGLLRTLLQLYSQSGHGQSVAGMVYSSSEKNTKELMSPAFTIFAESVPENFYSNLTEAQIQSGLLPRFNIIEYRGDRQAPNKAGPAVQPSLELLSAFCGLSGMCANLINNKQVCVVKYTPEGEKLLDEFEAFASNKIRGQTEVYRQLWNRAHLKALRLASLVAVGINPHHPEITQECAQWAINIALYDVNNISKRFESGEVGENSHEGEQIRSVLRLVQKFLNDPWEKVAKTTGAKLQPLHTAKIIPYTFLQKSTGSTGVFKNDKLGATGSLKRTIKTLCERGDLQVVPPGERLKLGTSSECYAVTNIEAVLAVDTARKKD